MSNYNFHKDLKRAVKAETAMSEKLCTFYKSKIKEIVAGDKDSKWDYTVLLKNGGSYTVEQKNDYMSEKTGNIAIEFESRGKASGIQVSKADFYLIVAKPDAILIHTKRLKELVKEKAYSRKHENGGDWGSKTKNYLFKKEVIKANGKLLFTKGESK